MSLAAKYIFPNINQLKLSEAERTKLEKTYHPATQLKKSNQLKNKKKAFVIFYTPEQDQAANGENAQIIVGAAGTGKTLLLQERTLQLLEQGHRVIVIAPKMFKIKYKQLFDDNVSRVNEKNYQIQSWPEFADFALSEIRPLSESIWNDILKEHDSLQRGKNSKTFPEYLYEAPIELLQQMWKNCGGGDELSNMNNLEQRKFIFDKLCDEARAGDVKSRTMPLTNAFTQLVFSTMIEELIKKNIAFCEHIQKRLSTQHIIIDDAMSETLVVDSDLACLALLAILNVPLFWTNSNLEFERTIWIAYDQMQFYLESNLTKVLLLWSSLTYCTNFSHVALKQVMRNSEEIFAYVNLPMKNAYEKEYMHAPSIGHKIQGVAPIIKPKVFFNAIEAWKTMSRDLPEIVTRLLQENAAVISNFIGIILTGNFSEEHVSDILRILQEKCPEHAVATITDFELDRKSSIVVARGEEVFSFEWPIVIRVFWGPVKAPYSSNLKTYCAETRAMIGLIVLQYVYDSANQSLDEIVEEDFPTILTPFPKPLVCLTADEAWLDVWHQLKKIILNLESVNHFSEKRSLGIVTDGSFAEDKWSDIVEQLSSEFSDLKTVEIGKYREEKNGSIFVGKFHEVLSFKWSHLVYIICEPEMNREGNNNNSIRLILARKRASEVSLINVEFKIETIKCENESAKHSNEYFLKESSYTSSDLLTLIGPYGAKVACLSCIRQVPGSTPGQGITFTNSSHMSYVPNSCLHHFQRIIVPQDGNCLYRSITEFMPSFFSDHAKLRAHVYDFYLSCNHENLRQLVGDPIEYANRKQINKDGSPAEDNEILVIATLFQRPVYVFRPKYEGYHKYSPLFDMAPEASVSKYDFEFPLAICLSVKSTGSHYEPLILKKYEIFQSIKNKTHIEEAMRQNHYLRGKRFGCFWFGKTGYWISMHYVAITVDLLQSFQLSLIK